MSIASVVMLVPIVGLFVYDWVTLRGMPRALLLQGIVFGLGTVIVSFPDFTSRVANAVGIGRGADFVLYLSVLWLLRESLVARRLRAAEAQRTEALVRALALRDVGAAPLTHLPRGSATGLQVPSSSASMT
jgi:small membrane protein